MKWSFGITLVAAIVLLVAGFCVPPMGVVDGSVLSAVGELFAFATLAQLPAIIGKAKHVNISHGDTQISIDDDK